MPTKTLGKPLQRRQRQSKNSSQCNYWTLEPRNLLAVVTTFQDGHLAVTLFADGDHASIDVVDGFVTVNDQFPAKGLSVPASEVSILSVKGSAFRTNQTVNFRGEFSELNSSMLDSLFAVDVSSVIFSGNYHVSNHAVVLLSRIESGGEITDGRFDGPLGKLRVDGFTWLNAGEGSISLKNPQHDFGGEVFLWSKGNTNQVTITDANDLRLAQTNIEGNFRVHAGGSISNSVNAAISIGGNAQIFAAAVEMGTNPTDSFSTQSLTFITKERFRVNQINDVMITGKNSAGSAWITTVGSIKTAPDTRFSTVGFAALYGGTGIELGLPSNNIMTFGSLTVNSPQQVVIDHDGPLQFAGNSSVDSLILSSTGRINNTPNARLNVNGDLSLDAPEIRLGVHAADFFQAGRINFQAIDHVELRPKNSLVFWGENFAGTLLATSPGMISTAPQAVLDVQGFAAFFGQNGIQLGTNSGNSIRSGGLTLNSPLAVVANLEGDVRFVGNSSVSQLTVNTTGDIRNGIQANLAVANDATFHANGITLGSEFNDSITLGRTHFSAASDVDIHQENRIVLFGNNQANNLKLASMFDVLDAPGTNTQVNGLFHVSGALINLATRDDETLNFGELTFNSSGNTNIRSNGPIRLIGQSYAGNRLILQAAGDITDLPTSTVMVVNRVDLTADNIVLGGALDRCFEIMGDDPTARLTLNTPHGGIRDVTLENC